MLYLDHSKLYIEDDENSIVHTSTITTLSDNREELIVDSPNVIASCLSQEDDMYQLVESRGVYLISKYSLESNKKSYLELILSPSVQSKFLQIFNANQRLYLIELDAEERRISLSSISVNNNVINHGSLVLKEVRSRNDLSCIFKSGRNVLECIVRDRDVLKIVEISINHQDSFQIQKETFYPFTAKNGEVILLNGHSEETLVALTNKQEGVMVIYTVLQDTLFEIEKTRSIEIIEQHETLEETFLIGVDEMIIISKREKISITLKKRTNAGHILRRISPRINSVESKEFNPNLSSINIKLEGNDLIGHLIGISYSTNCAKSVQHSKFNPACNEGHQCVSFNYGYNERSCIINEETISLKFLTNQSTRNARSKFLNQFQSIGDVYSSMKIYDTNIPLTTGAPVLSILNNAQGSFLRAVSTFNTSTFNDRRSLLSLEDNIISDVVAFADFILDDTSMGNSFELWLMSTDGKFYLEAQVSQFGVGKPIRIQIYPNLPGDAMTATRKSELETDRKICNEVKTNTLYRLILRLTNPTFSQATGQPLWTYHASIVEPTTAELEICSLEFDSTMKKVNYETIQDTTFAVGISQSAYSKLFSSTVLSLNVTANIRAIGLRCQSEDCNQIYIVPSLNDIIIISATLGSSLLFVLLVICLMISVIVCIIRPWHIELTEEQKKEMELRRNFERLQQLQRTMSLGHAHSPVRSLASSNRFQLQQAALNNSTSTETRR